MLACQLPLLMRTQAAARTRTQAVAARAALFAVCPPLLTFLLELGGSDLLDVADLRDEQDASPFHDSSECRYCRAHSRSSRDDPTGPAYPSPCRRAYRVRRHHQVLKSELVGVQGAPTVVWTPALALHVERPRILRPVLPCVYAPAGERVVGAALGRCTLQHQECARRAHRTSCHARESRSGPSRHGGDGRYDMEHSSANSTRS